MPLSRVAVEAIFVALLTLNTAVVAVAQTSDQPAVKQDTGEQQAVEQLRAIAETIKRCPEIESPDKLGVYFVSAPQVTDWDIVPRHSARSDKLGYIEFIVRGYYKPNALPECKKKDSRCQGNNWEVNQMNSMMEGLNLPDQQRYEFDLGAHGLEFSRSMAKHQTDDNTHWTQIENSPGNTCEGDAVTMTLHDRPPQIAESLWQAAKNGEADALTRLGAMYWLGSGVSQDYQEALHWYSRAANRGYAKAEYLLGAMYLKGQGVPPGYPQAMFWLRKAGEQSDSDAEYRMGLIYYYGAGVTSDVVENGKAYFYGDGIRSDIDEAYFWLSLAAMKSTSENSVEPARNLRDEIAAKLKPARAQEIQQRVDQWAAAHPAKQ